MCFGIENENRCMIYQTATSASAEAASGTAILSPVIPRTTLAWPVIIIQARRGLSRGRLLFTARPAAEKRRSRPAVALGRENRRMATGAMCEKRQALSRHQRSGQANLVLAGGSEAKTASSLSTIASSCSARGLLSVAGPGSPNSKKPTDDWRASSRCPPPREAASQTTESTVTGPGTAGTAAVLLALFLGGGRKLIMGCSSGSAARLWKSPTNSRKPAACSIAICLTCLRPSSSTKACFLNRGSR